MAESKRLPSSLNLPFIESLYEDFLRDPSSIPSDWRSYFQTIRDANGTSTGDLRPQFKNWSLFNPPPRNGESTHEDATSATLQERVDQLIRNYRVRGHNVAQLDPLGRPRQKPVELDPEFYGLSEMDLERRFSCETIRP